MCTTLATSRTRKRDVGETRGRPGVGLLATLLACLACLAWLPGAADAQDINCALQLQATPQTDRESDPKAELENGFVIGTAVLVKHKMPDKEEQFYLATAYHVIYKTTKLSFKTGAFSLRTFTEIEDRYYFNVACDLAVFRLTGPGREKARNPVVHPVQLLATPPGIGGIAAATSGYGPPEPSLGLPALALGNPRISTSYRPENIVYSCTVSEVVPALDRISSAIKHPKLEVENVAKSKKLMFLETLSIDKGFSGGPVLVLLASGTNGSGGRAEPRLAGLVLGGNPGLIVGRSAWACRAVEVEDAIKALEQQPSPESDDVKGFRYFPARTNPDQSRSNLGAMAWPDKVFDYGSTYSFSGTRVVEPLSPTPLIFQDRDWSPTGLAAGTAGGVARPDATDRETYLFNKVHFNRVRFHKSDLTNFQFNNCVFEDVCFDGAVLNGAVFADCLFRLREEPSTEGVLRDLGRPLMAYGVQIRNPQYEVTAPTNRPGEPPAPAFETAPVPPPPAPAFAVPAPPPTVANSAAAPKDSFGGFYVKEAPAGPVPAPAMPAAEAPQPRPGMDGPHPLRVVRFPSRAFDKDDECKPDRKCSAQ